jgi:RNA polymerase sigma-70 factor (ECF subfamily)
VTGPEAGDRVLVERTLAGNAVAFEQLITRYQQAVYATAYALLRDAHAAQDVVQETFLAAYRTLAKLKNPDRPRPWLTGIARNLAISARASRPSRQKRWRRCARR